MKYEKGNCFMKQMEYFGEVSKYNGEAAKKKKLSN